MKILSSCAISILFPIITSAYTLPVFDVNEMTDKLKDSLYLISVIDELLNETTGKEFDKEATDSYRREVEYLQNEINRYNQINQNLEELSGAEKSRSKVLVHQVKNITNYIRKVKTILVLASSSGARPEAITSSMKVLEQKRMRDKAQLEIALAALDAQDRIFQRRQKIRKKRLKAEALDRELSFIRGGEINLPVSIISSDNVPKKKDLW